MSWGSGGREGGSHIYVRVIGDGWWLNKEMHNMTCERKFQLIFRLLLTKTTLFSRSLGYLPDTTVLIRTTSASSAGKMNTANPGLSTMGMKGYCSTFVVPASFCMGDINSTEKRVESLAANSCTASGVDM